MNQHRIRRIGKLVFASMFPVQFITRKISKRIFSIRWVLGFCIGAALNQGAASAQAIPHIQRIGDATQLIVDGKPYLALAGELHNSSASSARYMAPIWDGLAQDGLNTVIGTASWELVEPQEGHFDFSAVDDEINQAHAHSMHLVLIWFGAYKNAESSYAPSWVRRDEQRFPRALRDPSVKPFGIGAFLHGPTLSVFDNRLCTADAQAFASLMRHVRQVDSHGTVIMVQVENETGIIGTARDHSTLADKAWQQPVPPALLRYLHQHRGALRPEIAQIWARQGYRERGNWADVFGSDAAAQEVFMAWGFGSYVGRVAEAGATEYPLPMYVNTWLGPQPGATQPGEYPSGGPVAHMMDVWRAAAPAIALQAPDIYIDDFAGTLADFHRSGNPIFIPEARFDAGNIFVALGQFNAIGFSPFGIEDGTEDDEVFRAYRMLDGMAASITNAQADGHIRGFRIANGGQQRVAIAGFDIVITRNRATTGAFGPGTETTNAGGANGYGLLIQTGRDEFTVIGRNVSLEFTMPGKQVEVDTAQEGNFENGKWIAGRTLNGDERFSLFPNDGLRIVKIKLLQRPSL